MGSGHGGLCVDMRWLGGGYAEIPVLLYEVPSMEDSERRLAVDTPFCVVVQVVQYVFVHSAQVHIQVPRDWE